MKTQYVNKKSELTAMMHEFIESGNEAYRTRIGCSCQFPHNFRYGVLVVRNNRLTQKVIRCKACTSKMQEHGTAKG